ncbi:hypothetical protein ACJX0J_039238, partial [Zea mays]
MIIDQQVSQARPILTCTRGIGQLHLLTFKHVKIHSRCCHVIPKNLEGIKETNSCLFNSICMSYFDVGLSSVDNWLTFHYLWHYWYITCLVETIQFSGILAKKSIILNVRTNCFVFKVVFTSPSLLLMNWRVALTEKQELGKFLLDVDYSCSDSVIQINMNLCMILVISNLVLGFEILIEYFFAFKLFRLPLFWVVYFEISYFIAVNFLAFFLVINFILGQQEVAKHTNKKPFWFFRKEKILFEISRDLDQSCYYFFDFVNFTRTNLHIVDRSSFTIGDRVNLLQLAVFVGVTSSSNFNMYSLLAHNFMEHKGCAIGQLHLLKGKHLFQSYFRLTFKHFQNKNKKEKKKQID